MRNIVLIIALGMFSLLCAQITSTLELTNIGTFSVSGVLTIENNTSSAVVWHFPDGGDFEILVDGQGSAVLYPQIPHTITIEPYESHVANVSNCRISAYSPGTHTAQAGIFQNGLQPMGEIQNFEVPFMTDDITALSYSLSITSIASNSITGILTVLNPGTEAWHGSFPYGSFAEIWVDGTPNDIIHYPGITDYVVLPGESFWQMIYHNQDEPYGNGLHTATVHLSIPGFPEVDAEQSFNVGPLDADDAVASAEIALDAYPNPFASELTISAKAAGEISIYNLRGQLLRSWKGVKQVKWDGLNGAGNQCPAGMYIIRSNNASRKVLKF